MGAVGSEVRPAKGRMRRMPNTRSKGVRLPVYPSLVVYGTTVCTHKHYGNAGCVDARMRASFFLSLSHFAEISTWMECVMTTASNLIRDLTGGVKRGTWIHATVGYQTWFSG